MRVIAFDAKNFDRTKPAEEPDPSDPSKTIKKEKGFFTPLGVGVQVKNGELFDKAYLEINKDLANEFNIDQELPFYSSNILKKELGMSSAIAFCNKLIGEIQDYIDLVHTTFVTLSLSDCPNVQVGGRKCPQKNIKTEDFLRSLPPMFSYVAAWNYIRRHQEEDVEVHIDGFRSKNTIAWEELQSRCRPKIYFRGDECNPFISFADIMSFMTDVRLYQAKKGPKDDPMKFRRLCVSNVEKVWEDCSFGVECRYLDQYNLPKYTWCTNDNIDTTPHAARPIVFILVDEIEKFAPSSKGLPPEQTLLETHSGEEPKRFKKVIQNMAPYQATVSYAYMKGGCAQFFDRYIDSDKVRDGDVLVYMGDNSKKIAMTYNDGYDVEVLQAKELREKVKKMFQDK